MSTGFSYQLTPSRMPQMKHIVLAAFAVALLATVFTGCSCVNIRARQVSLREGYEAQQKSLQATHDNMWKTIREKFNLSESYQAGFIKSLDAAVEGRKGGTLFKSVQENMPGLPVGVYQDMAATIEGKRDMMLAANRRSADIAREYNYHVQSPWHTWALSDTSRIDAKIITSGRSEDAYQSGRDDDILVGDK